MVVSGPTVMSPVAWMLRGTVEDLSTEAPAYILNTGGSLSAERLESIGRAELRNGKDAAIILQL